MSERCPVCRSAVEQKATTGRPRIYCRPACRRRAYTADRARADNALLSRAVDILRAANDARSSTT